MSKKTCFVIGPIGADASEQRIHADWLLHGIIKPVFQKHFPDFEVERADKIPAPGMVSSQIINLLHDAELVIADLSFHNANAFYEMSLRHKVGKPIIHMIRKGEQIPFDVIPHRAIYFSNSTPEEHEKAQGLLIPAAKAAIAPDFVADNPILHARGRLEMEKHATPQEKVLISRLDDAETRLAALERGGPNSVTNVLAGVVSHLYGVRVRMFEAGHLAFQAVSHAISQVVPEAVISSTGPDSMDVQFKSTTKGVQRVCAKILELPGIDSVDGPFMLSK